MPAYPQGPIHFKGLKTGMSVGLKSFVFCFYGIFLFQNTYGNFPDSYFLNIKKNGQTTILTNGYHAALTVRQFNSASNTPTVFQVFGTGDTRIYTQNTLTPLSIETNTGTVFRVTGNRRVGIGTGNPNCGLEIEPELNINGVCVKVNHTQPYGYGFTFEGQQAQAETKACRVWWNNRERFVVYANGKTFIGEKKIKPTVVHNDALLQVGGKIGCYELIVLDPSQWADCVFKRNFKLKTLSEIEQFYKEYGHLEGIPKEEEIRKNGLDVSFIIANLLEKIEELTIHCVELEKKIKKITNNK